MRLLWPSILALLIPVAATGDLREVSTPLLADVPIADAPEEQIFAGAKLTPSARISTYGGALTPHPLVSEAALILSEELAPYARGAYVTSIARAPEDQRRLMRAKRYRYWTIQRSKHLLGYAADIGFYKRRISMQRMHWKAESILRKRLGSDFGRLRVVREARCLHIELNTHINRDEIDDRTALLFSKGILRRRPSGHPVPALRDYLPERAWLNRPEAQLEAVAY